MTEVEAYVEEEYTTDVDIDFSMFSDTHKLEIIKAIINDDVYTFEEVPVCFSGKTIVDIDNINGE